MGKKKPSLKTSAKKPKDSFSSTEVGTLIENLEGQFKLVLEKQNSLADKIDSSMGMIAKNAEGITSLKIQTYSIKDDITKINGKIAKIEDDVRIIKNDIAKIDLKLTTAEKTTEEIKENTQKTLKYHESRLNQLEAVK